MTWGRTLKKALVRCGQSPDFAVWSKVAADRGEWRKLWGQKTPLPRQKPTAYAEQVLDIFYGPGPPPPDAPPPIAPITIPATPSLPASPLPALPLFPLTAPAPPPRRNAPRAARATRPKD